MIKKMFVVLPAHHVWCTEAAKTVNRLFSYAAVNYEIPARYPDFDFVFSYAGECDAEHESNSKALELLPQLLRHGSLLTPHLLNRIVSACAKFSSLCMGKQIHNVIIKLGLDANMFICTSLVNVYAKCDEMSSAQQVFNEMPQRSVVTWNSLIFGYLQVQLTSMAIEMFIEMPKTGMFPTAFTLSAVLVACSRLQARGLGIQVHGLCCNVVVGTGLIDMYSKCSIVDSRRVFDEMHEKNVVTFTSIVTGYAQNQQPDEAIILAREMRRSGIRLNNITYNSLLSSFSSLDDLYHGKQVHCQVIREGFEFNPYLVVTLITMYSDCSSLEDFCKILPAISSREGITWNSVIAGFSHLGYCEVAIRCFARMRQACVDMDFFTFTSILKAIGILSALEEGMQIHALIFKTGCASNVYVQNGLVSMYARCGAIFDSMLVFLLMDEPDLVSWNSLISGCAQNGYGKVALELFEQMRTMGIKPNQTTFLSVLSACSHEGLLDKGFEYFDMMKIDNSLEAPSVEHYSCMVNLLGRAGYLSDAECFVNSMPVKPRASVYKALLSACQIHGNVDIAKRAAKNLLQLWPHDPATYVLLSNVLVAGGYLDEAAGVYEFMCEWGVWKKPGCSWMRVSNKDLVFPVGGNTGN